MSAFREPFPSQQRRLSWSLQYTIPTEHFIQSPLLQGNAKKRTSGTWFVAEFRVDRQRDYSEIPSSMWSVQLAVQPWTKKVTARVFPQSDHKQIVSARNLLIHCTVRAKGGANSTVKIGPKGWTDMSSEQRSDDLSTLVEPKGTALRKGQMVVVIMTFEVATPRADLLSLLSLGPFADATIISSDNRVFPVHRAILSSAFPVFDLLFAHDVPVKMTGACKLPDIDGELLEMMLRYAYARGRPTTEDRIEELCSAAQRYGMDGLRTACEEVLAGNVRPENAMYYVAMARQMGLPALEKHAAAMVPDRDTLPISDYLLIHPDSERFW